MSTRWRDHSHQKPAAVRISKCVREFGPAKFPDTSPTEYQMSATPHFRSDRAMPPAPLVPWTFDLSRVDGLSADALEMHLGLYAKYIKEANAVIEQLQEFPRSHTPSAAERLRHDGLVRRCAFEHNGVRLHESFFEALSGPGKGPSAGGVFSEAVESSFGGFELWKADVTELANTRGVGDASWRPDDDVVPTTEVLLNPSGSPWTQPIRPAMTVGELVCDPAITPWEVVTGTTLRSRYVLEEVIGSGGDSIVFRGRDLHREAPDEAAVGSLAIKVLRSDQLGNAHALTRLKRSFRQMQGLAHVGIARVFDLDHHGDSWFMTMELVAGPSLHALLQQPISNANAIKLIGGCCEALEHAHSRGVRHGDLKPANVLVGSDFSVKLIDFGAASSPGALAAIGSDLSLAATPFFASPQVLRGEDADPLDDVFSLACLSYAVLSCGGRPFGDKTTLDASRDNMLPAYLADIPPRVFAVLARGLAMDREQRPATVREFLDQLTDATTDACSAAGRIFMQKPALPKSQLESAAVQSTVTVETQIARGEVVPLVRQPKFVPVQPLRLRVDTFVASENWAGFTFNARSMSVLSGNGTSTQIRSTTRQNPHVSLLSRSPARRTYILGLTPIVLGMVFLILHPVQPGAPKPAAVLQSLPATVLPGLVPAAAISASSLTVVPAVARASVAIGFESSTVTAVSAQPLVALQLKRLDSTRGPAAIKWQVVEGTAQPDVDYVRVAPQIARFIEGQTVRSIYIPLVARSTTAAPRCPRSFKVALLPMTRSPKVGQYSSVTVTIRPLPLD